MINRDGKVWGSLKSATSLIDVSDETIERRALLWQKEPEAYRVRYKLLVLGEDTRANRRYYLPDVLALLGDPRLHRRGRPGKLNPPQQDSAPVLEPTPE